ncbi:MAG: SMC-Scp complex subunit ScpB [Anaerovoracaceae bacterium]
MSTKKTIKSAFESMLFVWGEPLPAKTAAEVFDIPWQEAYGYFKELQDEYDKQERGILIREIDKAFQFCTKAENHEYIQRLCTPVKEKKLSQSALEVLAIVAYKQPVTKGEMEAIRGIKCDRVLEGLMNKGLVEEVGRGTGIGRPILYGTTAEFLKKFGFKNLNELPKIDDIDNIIMLKEEDEEKVNPEQIALDII